MAPKDEKPLENQSRQENSPQEEKEEAPPPTAPKDKVEEDEFTTGLERFKKAFINLLGAGVVITLFCSLVGYLGYWIGPAEFASHFRLPYLGIGLMGAALFGLFRERKWALVALLLIGVNFFEIAPWYMPRHHKVERGYKVRTMVYNVFSGNGNVEGVLAQIRKKKPHLLVILEVTPPWAKELERLKEIYPYRLVKAQENNFGIALLSRYPLSKIKEKDFPNLKEEGLGEVSIPTLVAEVTIKKRTFQVVATHPLPPINFAFKRYRDKHLGQMASFLAEKKGTTVLLGDLNITMWSPVYRRFASRTGLINSRRGFGILPTWPAITGGFPFFLPLDHILITPEVEVRWCRRGDSEGGDHYPLEAELVIPVEEE